jgi:DNA-binding IclR family transcriptional regulator
MATSRTAKARRASGGDAAQRNGIQVIGRAADVMRALADQPHGMSLSEVADQVELPRSTVHRVVAALEVEDLVTTGGGGRARLGPGLLRLANAQRIDLRAEVRPYLEELSGELEETVDLAVLDGGSVLFLDQVSGAHRLRAVSSVGAVFPAYCTANGKALLAELPPTTVRALLPKRLKPRTANTITSVNALTRELEEIRETGLAFDREEHTEGICAVGVAIHESIGAEAAITVPMPTQRFTKRERIVVRALLETRKLIERHFGAPEH